MRSWPLRTLAALVLAVPAQATWGIVLINQHVANEMRHLINDYDQQIPTVLEIPSKEHPYDADKDPIMKRVMQMIGSSGDQE